MNANCVHLAHGDHARCASIRNVTIRIERQGSGDNGPLSNSSQERTQFAMELVAAGGDRQHEIAARDVQQNDHDKKWIVLAESQSRKYTERLW